MNKKQRRYKKDKHKDLMCQKFILMRTDEYEEMN